MIKVKFVFDSRHDSSFENTVTNVYDALDRQGSCTLRGRLVTPKQVVLESYPGSECLTVEGYIRN